MVLEEREGLQKTGEVAFSMSEGHGVVSLVGFLREAAIGARVRDYPKGMGYARTVCFDASELKSWDSRLTVFVIGLTEVLRDRGVDVETQGLPSGMLRLMALAGQGDVAKGASSSSDRPFILARVGRAVVSGWWAMVDFFAFVGETATGLGKAITGKGHMRRVDFMGCLQDCGASALPIVALISIVIGVIFAFVGAVQLKMFGAQIYVADIVGLGMAREMGAMMTGIIMAGRTGAAFAAQIGTMQVNEEVDALTTMGMDPAEFLVVPRLMALVITMPLLCLYSDVLGIGGGMAIGVGMLDISWEQYWHQTQAALNITQFLHGIVKSGLYGIIIALAGCYCGMRCGRSASAVGEAATRAVVSAIVGIIITDGLIAVVTSILGV